MGKVLNLNLEVEGIAKRETNFADVSYVRDVQKYIFDVWGGQIVGQGWHLELNDVPVTDAMFDKTLEELKVPDNSKILFTNKKEKKNEIEHAEVADDSKLLDIVSVTPDDVANAREDDISLPVKQEAKEKKKVLKKKKNIGK